jgi:HAMP domain-containing protein
MKGNNLTIRKQFLRGILSVLVVIAIISGAIQLYLMNDQIVTQTNRQAEAVANNVFRGINQTDLATKTIEHQIDKKLVSYSKHIATLLDGRETEEISKAELIKIRDDLGLAGITILQETKSNDDIVAVVATEDQEIGFSFKQFGYYELGKLLLSGEVPAMPGATYIEKYTVVLPIAQSASHNNEPEFFKYAYYHVPGTDYLINPYIKANEVNDFIEVVGPDVEISNLVKEIDIIEEIAVLNPKVFMDPTLETQLYPPLKKIIAGSFNLNTTRDLELLTQEQIKKASYLEDVNGKKVYKMYLPLDENRVIYLALDYEEMSGPLYRHSLVLIISGLMSLLVLFLLTARYFNRIYENIQKIKDQIELLESGDLTVSSNVNDGTELDRLSKSTNRMVEKLNKLVMETHEQAKKTQRLSLLLEAEASQSVEKMYELSTEATLKSRDQLYEITEFLDEIVLVLQPYKDKGSVQQIIQTVEKMRVISNDRTAATTDTTIILSDLLKSLHGQSSDLSDISNVLLDQIGKFKL